MIAFWIIWTLVMALVLAFGLVLLVGAPYMPTLKKQQTAALDLLDLKPGQVVYDLGCGDGRFLTAAARRGLKAVGYELNPFMALIAWVGTRRYHRQVKVKWGNFWQADISPADGIFVFLLDRFMPRLDSKIGSEAKNGTKLVSYGFKIPGKKPAAKRGALLLYKYQKLG